MPYASLFSRKAFITKKDLCEVLNLNLTRPNLAFTEEEINKAYRKRMLDIHPDRQHRKPVEKQLPGTLFTLLAEETKTAKQHLLANQFPIPSTAFNQASSFETIKTLSLLTNLIEIVLNDYNTLAATLPYARYFSKDLYVALFLANYYENHLSINFLNTLIPVLEPLRPSLEKTDEKQLSMLLIQIREALNEASEQETITTLKKIFPLLQLNEDASTKEFKQFSKAIINGKEPLKKLLSKDLIDNIAKPLHYWRHFILHTPTWPLILCTHFLLTACFSKSIPKFLIAFKELMSLILTHKGMFSFTLSLLPMLILTAIYLPVNIMVQTINQALKLSFQLSAQTYQALYLMLNANIFLLSAIFSGDAFSPSELMTQNLKQQMTALIENSLVLMIKVPMTLFFNALDIGIYTFFDQVFFNRLLSDIHSELDAFICLIKSKLNVNQEAKEEQKPLPLSQLSFINTSLTVPLFNTEDTWLNNIHNNVQAHLEQEEQTTSSSLILITR